MCRGLNCGIGRCLNKEEEDNQNEILKGRGLSKKDNPLFLLE